MCLQLDLRLFFIVGRRTPTMIYVRESHVERMGKIQDVSYEILNVLEFNRFECILSSYLFIYEFLLVGTNVYLFFN